MRRRNPFGAAVFAFSGAPSAGFDAAVVVWTGEGEAARSLGGGSTRNSLYLRSLSFPICNAIYVTRWLPVLIGKAEIVVSLRFPLQAAAVVGVQHDSLVGRSDAARSPEKQCTARVFVKDCQIVVGVAGHPDHGGHGQQASGDRLPTAGLQLLQVVETMIVAGRPLCCPSSPDAKTLRPIAFSASSWPRPPGTRRGRQGRRCVGGSQCGTQTRVPETGHLVLSTLSPNLPRDVPPRAEDQSAAEKSAREESVTKE
jgi:hypothetical protein